MTGKELRKLRIAKGLTQEEFAKEVGVDHKQMIYRWEAGSKIGKTYQRILTEYFKK
jgi:transcriptional regulator with XRE-family HTH domain